MRILVVCQHYYPEPLRVADICEGLVKRGHDVTVITDVPNYPMGKVYSGYEKGKKRTETINGVKVHRCFTIARRSGFIWRVLNYYSYALSSAFFARKLKDEYDVVFVNQLSPVMMAYAGIAYKKKYNKKLLMYCLDLWPESLVAGGVKRGSLIYKYYHWVSSRVYKQVDKILVSSHSFKYYFEDEFGITEDKLDYLPQYSETIFTYDACKKTKGDTVDLMFAGNIGAAQSVDTIIKAAKLTSDAEHIRWHIVGDGSEIDNCKKITQELGVQNVIFHGRKSVEEMPEFYSMADAMIVTLFDDPFISLTLPGKVQSYMAAGKPIIAAANGEIEKVIKDSKCGICCPAQDSKALAEAAENLVEADDLSEYALNACKYNEENFSKEAFFNKLEKELEKLR